MLASVAGSMLWMNNWQVESFCALHSHRTTVKTSELARWKTLFSFKIPICDFHKLRHRCHNYRHGTTTKTQVFASGQNSQRTLQLTVKNILFFQNADSQFLMNAVICSILTLFTSCKHRHQYYSVYRHHPNFRLVNFLIFSNHLWSWDAVPMKQSLELCRV